MNQTSSHSSKSGSHIASLNGIRAISILLVLIGHASRTENFPKVWRYWTPFIFDGTLGVRIFFVLSGFLITTLLLREESIQGAISIPQFYRRRIYRIIPVYFSYIFFIWILSHFLSFDVTQNHFLAALTFTTGLWKNGVWILGHTWSLSIEEQFYLTWPAILIFCRTTHRRILVALSFLIALPFIRILLHLSHQYHLVQYSFLGNSDALMWGCLVALLHSSDSSILKTFRQGNLFASRSLAFTLILSIQALTIDGTYGIFTVPFGMTIQASAISYLIWSYAFSPQGVIYRVLNISWISWAGILSYSLYLWQEFFLCPFTGTPMPWWNRFPQNLGVTLVVAILSYYIIERPFLRLKQRA